MMTKARKLRLTVLGSTGSIGTNTLDVVARHPDRFEVFALSGSRQVDRLFEQCMRFRPRYAVLLDQDLATLLADRLNVRERDVIEMDQRLGSWELSLDQPIGQEHDGTLMDVLPAHEQPADEKLADTQLKALFRRKLAEFTKTLDEREEDILRNRILSETPLTLEDMGAKYGITKDISYISTGGGAFLEVLEGKTLPAFEILTKRAAG